MSNTEKVEYIAQVLMKGFHEVKEELIDFTQTQIYQQEAK